MKFDARSKLWLLAQEAEKALDHTIATHYVWLDGGYLIATNAHALVAVPVESRLARDADGPIPWRTVKKACALAQATHDDLAEIVCLKTKVKVGAEEFEKPKGLKPINWRKILESFRNEPPFRIRFNAALLKRMAAAMGEAGFLAPLVLDLCDDSASQTLARADHENGIPGAFGVVMPMRLDGMFWQPLPDDALPPKRKKGGKS